MISNNEFRMQTEVMPNQSRGDARAAPSAPPLHLMTDSSQDEAQHWGPPPRYDEAIAESAPAAQPERQPRQAPRLPSPTSQDQTTTTSRLNGLASRSPSRANVGRRSRQSINDAESGAFCQRRVTTRHRSASPGELSDGTQNDSQERACNDDERAKKRSSGSKIKKGLESIAFFIIQILD